MIKTIRAFCLSVLAAYMAPGCSSDDTPPIPVAAQSPTDESLAGFYVVRRATTTLGAETRDLLPGFGFEIKRVAFVGGVKAGVSRLGQFIPFADVSRVKPASFRGVKDPDPALRIGFVIRANAPVRAQPSAGATVVARLPKLATINLVSRDGPTGFYATSSGWVAAPDLRVATPALPPAGVSGNETWIDIDLQTQTLVMYAGIRPTYATLISGGVGEPGTAFATPLGVHRIVAKLWSATMDNLEHTNVVPYHYESVPFTQYIGRVALHGVFWHDDFGRPKSHGCINLSLADAAYLFDHTAPALSAATESIRGDRGTIVQVR